MRITFFGSGHGIPEPHKKCSSAMVEVGEHRYIIDMGTQVIEGLTDRRLPVKSVKAIFITHMHGDHTNGLLSFLDLCSWKYTEADPAVYLPEDTDRYARVISEWISCNHVTMRPFRFFHVEAGCIYDDGMLRVTAYRTKHLEYSYAYLLEAEGKRVLFSGDLSKQGPLEDFPTEVLDEGLDLAVCECAHFDATKYLPIFEGRTNIGRICFNHFSNNKPNSATTVGTDMPHIPVVAASDGMDLIV